MSFEEEPEVYVSVPVVNLENYNAMITRHVNFISALDKPYNTLAKFRWDDMVKEMRRIKPRDTNVIMTCKINQAGIIMFLNADIAQRFCEEMYNHAVSIANRK